MDDVHQGRQARLGFALGLIFLPFIFIPILGFGEATYAGPAAGPVTGSGDDYSVA